MSTPSPQFEAFNDVASAAHHDSNPDGIISHSDIQTMRSELSAFGCDPTFILFTRGAVDDRTAAMRRRLQKKMAARKAAKEAAKEQP